jgi:signal transduction histidine kinase
MAQPARIQQLTAALRASASRAASTTGGCALIFAIMPGNDGADASAKLRAAAGFASPDEARGVSQEVLADIEDVVSSQESKSLAPLASLGERAAGGVIVLPLLFEDRIHGALAVASPVAIDATSEPVLAQIASNGAVHLDHLRVLAELESMQAAPTRAESAPASEDKTDELLKLSEELFAQDIQLLRSNEKLGKIEKLKNDFIEKMSLELRTPLNAIIEAIISVLAGENDAISDYAKASLRTALDEGTAFQRTLQNILDLWRIKQGELPTEIQDVNFTETVEETIFSVQETLDSKGIEIEKQIEEPMPKVLTDLAKANQILFLLLENAAKFTEQGQITISARVEKETLHCSVADTGIGICPDDQQLIYDEFFQVDEFSSHRYRGAGLGLTLVRDLLVLLEGELHLESEPGHGTTVSFSIPVQLA